MKKNILLFFLLISSLTAHAADYVWYDGKAVTYRTEGAVSSVVGQAIKMFSSDMTKVTGKTPRAVNGRADITIYQLDNLNAKDVRKLRHKGVPVDSLAGRMDAFYIKADKGIIIVGSNGRGCAYGLLELSRHAGVSPWVWWGDVTPKHQDRLTLPEGFTTLQAPSVEYRGLFINDEDFAIREWSAKTFEPEDKNGGLGPKTYKKIYQLLLRLRANTIWPAMHPNTTAFFQQKGNKEMADSFSIVVGTSHCEPLLRNNVGEWNVEKRGRFNFITNKQSVVDYWTERLKEVNPKGNYFYTLGMRGIHDGRMEGVKTLDEQTEALQRVIDCQRELLAKYINKDVTKVPQVFVPYKEVLQVMENGVKVPDDVTLMWCDDNYGYLTRLSDSVQQKRSGGSGVYYHLSYWGRPHDYLWLTTVQPGLVYNQMRQAYDHNARKLWIANVHDPKVAAYQLQLFLDMAWNINSVTSGTLANHLQDWLTTQFGDAAAKKLLPVMQEFYRLTGIRRPEFMGWNQTELDKKKYKRGWSPVADSEFSLCEFGGELDKYLACYERIAESVESIGKTLRPDLQDAYFAAIVYPVKSASAMAHKMLEAQKARRTGSTEAAKRATAAYQEIKQLTEYYNNELSEGKWKRLMNASPRGLYVFGAPTLTDTLPKVNAKASEKEYIAVNADKFADAPEGAECVQMLGHSMDAVSLPKGGTLSYRFNVKTGGKGVLYTALIPTQPNDKGDLRYSVSVDGGTPVVFSLKEKFRSERWKLNVLRGQTVRKQDVELDKGAHTLTIKALDEPIIVDQWMVDFDANRKFYTFPTSR